MSVLNFKRGKILRLLVAPVHAGAGVANIGDVFSLLPPKKIKKSEREAHFQIPVIHPGGSVDCTHAVLELVWMFPFNVLTTEYIVFDIV